MIFYWSVLGVFIIASLFEIFGLKRSQDRFLFWMLTFLIFFLGAFRWEVGTDWASYYRYFSSNPSFENWGEFELLFSLLNYIINAFTNDYTLMLCSCAIVIFSLQSVSISKYSIYPLTSLLILVGVSFGNVFFVRQNIAIAILFYSVRFIQEKKFLPFILLVIIAFGFHKSSILFIVSWWIYRLNLTRKFMIITIIISLFSSVAFKTVLESFGGFFGQLVDAKLSKYMGDSSDVAGSSYSYTTLILKGAANKIIVFFIAMWLYDKHPIGRSLKGYINIYWLGIIIYFSMMSLSIVLVRFSFPFDIFQIIIIPYAFSYCKNNFTKTIGFICLIMYLSMRFFTYFLGYKEFFLPYKTIF